MEEKKGQSAKLIPLAISEIERNQISQYFDSPAGLQFPLDESKKFEQTVKNIFCICKISDEVLSRPDKLKLAFRRLVVVKDEKQAIAWMQFLLNFSSLLVFAAGPETGNTALHIAAQENKINIVKFLLEWGANKDYVNKKGQKAEVLTKNAEIIKLLAAVVPVSSQSMPSFSEKKVKDEFTITCNILLKMCSSTLIAQIESRAYNVNQLYTLADIQSGHFPLFVAIRSKNLQNVRKILENEDKTGLVSQLSQQLLNGMNPLMDAIRNGNLEIVKYICKKVSALDTCSAIFNHLNCEKQTALVLALRCGFHDPTKANIAPYLLGIKNINVYEADTKNYSTLLCAMFCKWSEKVCLRFVPETINKDVWPKFLRKAMGKGYFEVMKKLLEKTSSLDLIEYVEVVGEVFARAAAKRWFESLNIILKNRPEFINSKNKCGISLLSSAVMQGNMWLVKYLLCHRPPADVNRVDNGGFTPLYWGIQGNFFHIVRFLLEKGAQANYLSWSCVFAALGSGSVETIRLLIEYGLKWEADLIQILDCAQIYQDEKIYYFFYELWKTKEQEHKQEQKKQEKKQNNSPAVSAVSSSFTPTLLVPQQKKLKSTSVNSVFPSPGTFFVKPFVSSLPLFTWSKISTQHPDIRPIDNWSHGFVYCNKDYLFSLKLEENIVEQIAGKGKNGARANFCPKKGQSGIKILNTVSHCPVTWNGNTYPNAEVRYEWKFMGKQGKGDTRILLAVIPSDSPTTIAENNKVAPRQLFIPVFVGTHKQIHQKLKENNIINCKVEFNSPTENLQNSIT